jgi:hypothetical protein
MSLEGVVRRSESMLAAGWIGGFALAFLALRGTLGFLLVPGAAVVLAVVVAGLALGVQASVTVYERLVGRLPGRRLLWLLPLVNLAVASASVSLPLAMPSWCGDHELWKDLLGMPPTPFTRLVTTIFVLVAFHVAYLFMRLVVRFLADPRSWQRTGGDGITTLVFALGLVVLAATILYGQAHRQQNVLFLRGGLALGIGGRPGDALRSFAEVVERYPKSGLADACMYRMARIESDEMGHPAEAVAHFKQLIARWPDSPYCDDALLDLAELSLGPLADPASAETWYREVIRRFPRSYLAERASLGLARALASRGQAAEAAKVLDALKSGAARGRIVREDGDGRLVVEPLGGAIDTVRRSINI